MNQEEFLAKMKERCPNLYKKLSYIECDEGWFNLIKSLSTIIENKLKDMDPSVVEGIYIVQIKEKFGGLRFYISEYTPFFEGAIELAEALSFTICETCGNSNAMNRRVNGWYRTECDVHYNERVVSSERR
jgi:hypothetical protein